MSTSFASSYKIFTASTNLCSKGSDFLCEQIDVQPLDLRIHPTREEIPFKQSENCIVDPIKSKETSSQDHGFIFHPISKEQSLMQTNQINGVNIRRLLHPIKEEHIDCFEDYKRIRLDKKDSLENMNIYNLGQCSQMGKSDCSSSHSKITLSLLSDTGLLSFQDYVSRNSTVPSQYYLSPEHPLSKTLESAPFQHSVAPKVTKDVNSASSEYEMDSTIVTPVDFHLQESPMLIQHSYNDDDTDDDNNDDNERPFYLDLDSKTLKCQLSKSKREYNRGNSSNRFNNKIISNYQTVRHGTGTDKFKPGSEQHLPKTLQKLLFESCESEQKRSFSEGGAGYSINEQTRSKVSGRSRASSDCLLSKKNRQRKYQPQCLPGSSSSPDNVMSLPYDSKSRFSNGNKLNLSPKDNNNSIGSNTKPNFSSSGLLTNHLPMNSGIQEKLSCIQEKSLGIQEKFSGIEDQSYNSSHKFSVTCIPTKSLTCLSEPSKCKSVVSFDNSPENKRKRHLEQTECNALMSTNEIKEDSKKISSLDFWMSKVLMEHSAAGFSPRPPCCVDYFCTASGEKKIRLRLVDLIELHVEQSLKE